MSDKKAAPRDIHTSELHSEAHGIASARALLIAALWSRLAKSRKKRRRKKTFNFISFYNIFFSETTYTTREPNRRYCSIAKKKTQLTYRSYVVNYQIVTYLPRKQTHEIMIKEENRNKKHISSTLFVSAVCSVWRWQFLWLGKRKKETAIKFRSFHDFFHAITTGSFSTIDHILPPTTSSWEIIREPADCAKLPAACCAMISRERALVWTEAHYKMKMKLKKKKRTNPPSTWISIICVSLLLSNWKCQQRKDSTSLSSSTIWSNWKCWLTVCFRAMQCSHLTLCATQQHTSK